MSPCTVMVPHASIISENHYSSLSAMFILLHSSMNQELFEKYICSQSGHYEKYGWCCAPQLSSKIDVSIALLCQLCSTCYTAIRIKSCIKNTSVIRLPLWKISVTQRKPSCETTQSMLFTVNKEWNTKEDTGKSMKSALHVLRYAKRHLSGWSDVEQWSL